MVLQESEKEIQSKKRRNGRYASNGGCLGCRLFSFELIDQLRFIIMIRSFAILIRLSNIKEDIFRVVLHFLWFAMGRKGTKRMVGGLKLVVVSLSSGGGRSKLWGQ